MPDKKKEYERLPGRGCKRGSFFTAFGTRTSIWLGTDHLLCVTSSGFSEDYKRFYYSDIQAIVTQKTPRYKTLTILLAIISVLLSALSISLSEIPAITGMIITAVFLACLIIHLFRGPTCTSYLYTAVSKEELYSLNRMKNAARCLSRIIPRIEERQGRLEPEEIKARSEEAPMHTSTRSKTGISPAKQAKNVTFYNGTFHVILFSLLLAGGLLETAAFFITHVTMTVLSTVIGWALAVFVIIALIKQHGSSLRKGLRTLTWITLGYMVISYFAGIAISSAIFIKKPESMGNQFEMMQLISELSPFDNPLLLGYYIFSITYSFIAGIAGLLLLRKYRGTIDTPSSSPAI